MTRVNFIYLFVFLLVSFSLIVVACSSDDGADLQTGATCSLDTDCGDAGLICASDNTCQLCISCESRMDCDTGFACDNETGCCKEVKCNNDFDCDDGLYCLEFVCREKSCESQEDCLKDELTDTTKSDHHCAVNICKKKECLTNSDCETNLCNASDFACINCSIDDECEGELVCSSGACIESSVTDGDGIGEKMGCDEFKNSCMYAAFKCFDKLKPVQSFSDCVIVSDENELEGFSFSFSDGSRWEMYGVPPLYHVARGAGGYCYKVKVESPITGFNPYFDQLGTAIGKYGINRGDDLVRIVCPDGTEEFYGFNALQGCPGFVEEGIYSPPSPGFEACHKP